MKTQSNFRKNLLENTSDSQAKTKFICVVEEDLDFEHLQSAEENCDSQKTSRKDNSEKIRKFKYLCYLRSMDDMS